MNNKKWITQKELSDLLKTYSIRTDEFEQLGNDDYFFQSKYVKGYALLIEPEIQYGTERTGRIIVSHTKNGGKRTFQDIWEYDQNNKLQFVFRNPWNKPFADYDYIHDLESQIAELREDCQKLQTQLVNQPKSVNEVSPHQESSAQMQQDHTFLKTENEALRLQIDSLTQKYQELINKTKHNARGAGRKPDPQHLQAQVKEVQNLLAAGKNADEIMKIMKISRSSFFRYKKFIKK